MVSNPFEGMTNDAFNKYMQAEMMETDPIHVLNLVKVISTMYKGFLDEGIEKEIAAQFTINMMTAMTMTAGVMQNVRHKEEDE